MAVVYKDRVKETTTTTGTGAIALGGAPTGFNAFSSVFLSGNQTHYCIEGQGTGEWEVGLGTLTSGTPWTLARTTILASSNGGSAVNFSAGTKNVYCDVPASVIALIQSAVQPSRQVVAGAGLTGGGDLSADRTIALALTSSIVTTALGYVPVQQGTGVGQFGNLIKIGWSGTRVKLTVDTSDLGNILTDGTVDDVIASLAAGGIGTYGFFYANTAVGTGTVYAGNNLVWSNGSATSGSGVSPSGSWRCLGASTVANKATLFVRVS